MVVTVNNDNNTPSRNASYASKNYLHFSEVFTIFVFRSFFR